jgi:hypothetical protein
MGMYTELHYNVELKSPVPTNIINTLQYMLGETEEVPPNLPDHKLFQPEGRWRFMLRCDSYYFSADTHSTLRLDYQGGWYLCIRCNLKNYSEEIENFIDWMMPYIDNSPGNFLGFYRYEESEIPTLIYAK